MILVLHSTREAKAMDRWTAHSGGPILVNGRGGGAGTCFIARGQHFACPAFSLLMMIGGPIVEGPRPALQCPHRARSTI